MKVRKQALRTTMIEIVWHGEVLQAFGRRLGCRTSSPDAGSIDIAL